jgi:hypothetical protein
MKDISKVAYLYHHMPLPQATKDMLYNLHNLRDKIAEDQKKLENDCPLRDNLQGMIDRIDNDIEKMTKLEI